MPAIYISECPERLDGMAEDVLPRGQFVSEGRSAIERGRERVRRRQRQNALYLSISFLIFPRGSRGGHSTHERNPSVQLPVRKERVPEAALGRHHVGVALGPLLLQLLVAELGAWVDAGFGTAGGVGGRVEARGLLEDAGFVRFGSF